ncbi:MAG: 16S rRNA (cytidine(1402)-2'-O)-methyltransferase, partial [Bacteroidetes bacterium]|nr:16S rRNA (cytidine(1402)-2'-O)-methyltransferase [Bacteroidota bacterium]
EAAVTRELTKRYEEVRRDRISNLINLYGKTGAPKGEIVVVLAQAEQKTYNDDELKACLKKSMAEMSVKDAVALVAEATGHSKRKLYAMALSLSDDNSR